MRCEKCWDQPPINYCDECKADWKKTKSLLNEGHTMHCACRIQYGDGECTCNKPGGWELPESKEYTKTIEDRARKVYQAFN